MSSELSTLLDRVKAATGPDQEIDEAIWLSVVPGASRKNVMAEWPEEEAIWEYSDPERNLVGRSLVPRLSASIDAALALVDRSLPGWGVYFRRDKETTGAGMLLPDHFRVSPAHEEAASIPLAILAALLSALIAYPIGGRMDE